MAAAVLLRAPVWPWLGNLTPYLTLYPAVIFTAYRFGFRAGLLATILSILASVAFFIVPQGAHPAFEPAEIVSVAYFGVLCLIVLRITDEMRKARFEAEEQRRVWHQTLASIGDAVIATGATGNVTFLNGAAERLTGWTEAEARGRPLAEVFVIREEATGRAVEAPLTRVLRDGMIVGLANHTMLVARDGRQIPIDDSGAPIRDGEGAIIGAVLVFRDITQRRENELQLERSRERLRTCLESITDAFFALDSEWRFTYVNAEAARLMARSREELLGRQYADILPHMRDSEVERTFRRVMTEGVPEHFDYLSPRSLRWYEMHAFPAEGGSLSVYFRDISHRKRTEALLRDREQRLNVLVESNVIGIVFGDVHGAIRHANDELLRIIGRSRRELTDGAIRWDAITPPEHADADARGIAEAKQRGACTPYEKEYIRPDGSRVPVYVGFVLLGEEREESVAFVVDLSERKAVERALLRSNEDLQHFTYGASHDLKEPLRMVTTYSQLLERRYGNRLDGEAQELIRYIQQGVVRMRALVDALLEYSQAGDAARRPASPASAQIALEHSLFSLKQAIDETKASITCDPLPEVLADELHLTQLFQNLVANSINYRSGDPPRIHISCTSANGVHRFSVSDNGLGIPPQYHERIFGVFQRLHGRERSGSGIGLATCKRIVERYGGRIWVESDGQGAGATFHFTLPAALPAKG